MSLFPVDDDWQLAHHQNLYCKMKNCSGVMVYWSVNINQAYILVRMN